jgi:hypothetical protein
MKQFVDKAEVGSSRTTTTDAFLFDLAYRMGHRHATPDAKHPTTPLLCDKVGKVIISMVILEFSTS